MTSVVSDDLQLEYGRGKEEEVWGQRWVCILALLLPCCWAVDNSSFSKSIFPHQTTEGLLLLPPSVPMMQSLTVWELSLAVLELGQWKTWWVDYLMRLEKPTHPPWRIATSSSSTFNDHKLWDHAHNGWHWPKETWRGGLIKWGVKHDWSPTQWPSSAPLFFLSGCGQLPTVEAKNPGTHFPSLLCI